MLRRWSGKRHATNQRQKVSARLRYAKIAKANFKAETVNRRERGSKRHAFTRYKPLADRRDFVRLRRDEFTSDHGRSRN